MPSTIYTGLSGSDKMVNFLNEACVYRNHFCCSLFCVLLMCFTQFWGSEQLITGWPLSHIIHIFFFFKVLLKLHRCETLKMLPLLGLTSSHVIVLVVFAFLRFYMKVSLLQKFLKTGLTCTASIPRPFYKDTPEIQLFLALSYFSVVEQLILLVHVW